MTCARTTRSAFNWIQQVFEWHAFVPNERLRLQSSRARLQPETDLSFENLEARQLLAGDMVVQWNEQLLEAIRATTPAPPVASRAMAIVHTAIFDAVNSIHNHYEPYATFAAVHPKASAEAAVAAAAERTLASLFPSRQATFASALESSLQSIADGIREDQGVAAGRFVADQILAMRAGDGFDRMVAYASGSEPGDWVPTPPGFKAPALPQWGFVQPWAMSRGNQFRSVAPPDLTNGRYTIDYDMVKELGSLTSTTRTAAQTEVARIWEGGPGTATPPGQWNMIAQDLAASQGNSLYDNARMFAVLNIALADAAISAWDTKYAFDYWRPVTAIQHGDVDGNADTVKDESWTPLLTTPNFPTYTSGHSTFSGAGSTALAGFFGTDSLNFKLESEVPGASTRYFDSLAQAAREAGFSRIFGGIHFNFDNLEGLAAGRGIGNLVTQTQLQPQTQVIARMDGHQLYIHGTTQDDNIFGVRIGSTLMLRNHGHLIGQFPLNGLWNIVADGSAGNDRIEFAYNVGITTEQFGGSGHDWLFGSSHRNWLYGESGSDHLFGSVNRDVLVGAGGNDWLYGFLGDDTLVGGNGNDGLYGHAGKDVLIGGLGTDWMFGGLGGDLLVGSRTAFDGDGQALQTLSAAWQPDLPYDFRVNQIRFGSLPLPGVTPVRLADGVTVFDDGVRDHLYGGADLDLFLAESNDTYWDLAINEVLE